MFSQIKKVAKRVGNDIALMDDIHSFSYNELVSSVESLAGELKRFKYEVVALYIDNCPEWVVIDLACQVAGIKLLPLPAFFSDLQLRHAVMEAGAKVVIHLHGDRLSGVLELQYNSCLLYTSDAADE